MKESLPFDVPMKKNLFKKREVLTSSYIPTTLPGRKKQIKDIQYFLYPALQGELPSNFLIYGKPGSGKTVVVRHVIRQLNEKISQKEIPDKLYTLYMPCLRAVTETQALRFLLTELQQQYIPSQGWGRDRYYNLLEKILKKKEKGCIIVLDEIDKLKGDWLLYNLTRIEGRPPTIIGISNNLRFVENLDPRVISSFGEKHYVFSPYNAVELERILYQRAELGLKKDVLSEDVIPLCAAFAAQEHGDARKAIDLLRESVEIAQDMDEEKVSEQHLRKAQIKIEKNIIKEVVEKLPIQCKIVLLSIVSNIKNKKKVEATSVYETYQKMCSHISLSSVTYRRFSYYINELDMLGVINTKVVYKGRYGKSKDLYLKSGLEIIEKILLLDETLPDFKNYERKWF